MCIATHAHIIDDDAESALAKTIRTLMERKYGWSDGLMVELTLGAGIAAA